MIWQELVFVTGSIISIVTLMPTLRNVASVVPRKTSLPAAVLGITFALTYASMDMYVSGSGALVTGLLWAAIARWRSEPA